MEDQEMHLYQCWAYNAKTGDVYVDALTISAVGILDAKIQLVRSSSITETKDLRLVVNPLTVATI